MTRPTHQSFVLRLWQEQSAGTLLWRFMLLNATTGEQQGFATLEQLTAFLKEYMDELS